MPRRSQLPLAELREGGDERCRGIMNTDYSKWSKFDVEEEDAAPQGIGAPPSMAFEDLDRVVGPMTP